MTRIGLISDTHGLLRADVHDALAGTSLILHAGDVGGEEILRELALIAPVQAVFGNTDPPDHPGLFTAIDRTIDGVSIHVSHGHEVGAAPDRLLERYRAQVIVYGHTHRPLIVERDGRLLVNPGAAGPRRFAILPSVAILEIENGVPSARHIPLQS
jgi:uncharacterized protein